MKLILIFLLMLPFVVSYIPLFTIQAYDPKGIKACVSDQKGMIRMDFHANINKNINLFENGEISGTVTRPTQSIWCFIDRNINIKRYDNIYYWGMLYTKDFSGISDVRNKKFYRKYNTLNYVLFYFENNWLIGERVPFYIIFYILVSFDLIFIFQNLLK